MPCGHTHIHVVTHTRTVQESYTRWLSAPGFDGACLRRAIALAMAYKRPFTLHDYHLSIDSAVVNDVEMWQKGKAVTDADVARELSRTTAAA